jgi:hypothetical protein
MSESTNSQTALLIVPRAPSGQLGARSVTRLYPASGLEGCVVLGDSHLAHDERSGRSLRTNLFKAVGSPLGLAASYGRHGLRC